MSSVNTYETQAGSFVSTHNPKPHFSHLLNENYFLYKIVVGQKEDNV